MPNFYGAHGHDCALHSMSAILYAAGLPAGTYSLGLVCRSQRRVSFTVRTEQYTQLDLSLRCGSTRENVIYLSEDSALSFRVESRSLANYAYRLIRLGA